MAQFHQRSISPRILSYIFGCMAIVIGAVLSYPLSLVFSGEWIVKQQIDLFVLDELLIFGQDFGLNPGLVSLRYYSIMIFLAMISGYFLSIYLSKWHYIASTVIDRLFIGLLIFGLIGARVVFVLFNWESYEIEPVQALFVFRGGLAFFGMLYLGILYVWVYCSRFRFNLWEFLDVLAPGVLLGQIIGRWGNFFNYEAYGGPTKFAWKMFVPDTANIYTDIDQMFFHPTFLYEIIPNTIMLFLLLFNYEELTRKRAGLVFGCYAIGYGLIRYCTEFFRLDALVAQIPDAAVQSLDLPFNELAISQILALVTLCWGVFIIWKRGRVIYLKKTMSEYAI